MRGTFIKLHFSVLLAGATGLFGKLITLNEGVLVWYRMMFAAILLGLFLLLSRRFPKIGFRDFSWIALVGSLLALHWVFFMVVSRPPMFRLGWFVSRWSVSLLRGWSLFC